MLVTKQLTAPIDFHCIFFLTIEVNECRQVNCLVPFKISYFMFNRRKRLIQIWNNFRWNK